MKRLLCFFFAFLFLFVACINSKSGNNVFPWSSSKMDSIVQNKDELIQQNVGIGNSACICEIINIPLPEKYTAQATPKYNGNTFVADIFLTDEDGTTYADQYLQTVSFDLSGDHVTVIPKDDMVKYWDGVSLAQEIWELNHSVIKRDEKYFIWIETENGTSPKIDLPSIFNYNYQREQETYHYDGKSKSPFKILNIYDDEKGSYYILTTEGVCAIDSNFNVIWVQGEQEYPSALVITQKGILYLAGDTWDKSLYMLNDSNGKIVALVDLPAEISGTIGVGSSSRSIEFYGGDQTYDFFISTKNSLWGANIIETKNGNYQCEIEERINWLNSGISPESISHLCIADKDTVAAIQNWGYEGNLLLLKRMDTIVKKGVITLVTFSENQGINRVINQAIELYNRSASEYIISVIDFTVYNKDIRNSIFNAEMAAGRVPDIVLLQTDSEVDSTVFTYKNSEIFTDLIPLMQNCQDFNYDHLLGYVTNPYRVHGQQRIFPLWPMAETLFGSSERFAGPITAEDLIELIKKLPSDTKLCDNDSYESIILDGILNDYYNLDTANCNFGDDSFINILSEITYLPEYKIAKNEHDHVYNPITYFRSIGEGKTLLVDYEPWSVADYALMKLCTGNSLIPVGYPNAEKKLYVRNGWGVFLSITESSQHKDEAFSFLNLLLSTFSNSSLNNVSYFTDDIYNEYRELENKTIVITSTGASIYDDSDIPSNSVKTHKVTEIDAQEYIDYLNSITDLLPTDSPIYSIYKEECSALSSRPVEKIANIIQSRVSIYLSEQYQ